MISKHILKDFILYYTTNMLVSAYKTIQCKNPEEYNLNTQCSENLKTCITLDYFNIHISLSTSRMALCFTAFFPYIYIYIHRTFQLLSALIQVNSAYLSIPCQCLGLSSIQDFWLKCYMYFSSLPYLLHALHILLISSSLASSP
jgi:hypothetical protein